MEVKEGFITVTDDTGIDMTDENSIEIYPNPAMSIVNVSAEGMQRISILDITGKLVLDIDSNSDTETIDISKFQWATYAIRITTNTGTFVRTLVVE